LYKSIINLNNFEVRGIFQTADRNKDNLIDDEEWAELYEHFIEDF
jgi:hypothetical protein